MIVINNIKNSIRGFLGGDCLNDFSKNQFLYLGVLVAFIVSATVISLRFSRDSYNYNRLFEMFGESGWSGFAAEIINHELFIIVVSKVLYMFGLGAVFLFLIHSAISLSVKFYLVNKTSSDKWLSLAFFSSYFLILHDATQIRFGIAIAFVYLALHYLAKSRRLLFFTIVIFSSVMFHNAVLVFIIMLFFTSNKSYLWACFMVVIAIMLYPVDLNAVVLEIVGNIVNVFNLEGTGLNRLTRLYGVILEPSSDVFLGMFRPIPLLVYFCAIIIFRYRNNFSVFEMLSYNALLLSIFFYILLKDVVDLQVRFADMFGFSLVFLVPYVHRGLSEYVGKKYAYIILYSFFAIHLIKYTLYDKMLVL